MIIAVIPLGISRTSKLHLTLSPSPRHFTKGDVGQVVKEIRQSITKMRPVRGRGPGMPGPYRPGGKSSAGLRAKKPHGTSLKPAACTGITGQSSGRGLWVMPMEYHSTTS